MNKATLIIGTSVFLSSILSFTLYNRGRKEIKADKIYINGKVITVDPKNSIAQAVAVKDGKILAVGSVKDIQKLADDQTISIDLQGKTLVPGFIDGHSHFMSLERVSTVNVAAPPVGNVTKIADVVTEIQKFINEKNIKEGSWVAAFGYDVDQLAEKRHLEKEDLDAAFPNIPVVVTHVSGHMAVLNSLALSISGINSSTKDPEGGVIVRKKDSNEPTGLLQESALYLIKRPAKPKLSLDQQIALLKDQQLYYASHGVTTAQDGFTTVESLELLTKASEKSGLFIDIEVLPGYVFLKGVLADSAYKFGVLKNHLKLAGTKFVADGSPQGKTAFFSKAYLTEVPGCNHDQCTGFPILNQKQLDEGINYAFKNNIRPFVHCNGDATIDLYIKSIESANKSLNTTSNERRPVTIHSQFVRPDQLDTYKKLGIVPAFFSNHAFFWGDVHIKNLGIERANFLSPLKSASNKGIIATNHTDFPVTPINQIFLLWTSVVRQSRTGTAIGENERLSVIEGLRAITINGAYQYLEEKTKGTIEKGKLADFVVLSDDILTIDPAKIKDVTVLETIKEGNTVYKR